MNCNLCNSTNVEVRKVKGRGLPPKEYVRRPGLRVSWEGTWEIFKCQCGNEWRNLIK